MLLDKNDLGSISHWAFHLSDLSDSIQAIIHVPSSLLLCGRSRFGASIERIESKKHTYKRTHTVPVLLSVEQSSVKKPLSDRT